MNMDEIKKNNAELTEEQAEEVGGGRGDRFRMMSCPSCKTIFRFLSVGSDGMCPNCGKEKAYFIGKANL